MKKEKKKHIRRFLKLIFKTTIFCLAGVAIALFFIIQKIDPNDYKKTIEEQVTTSLNREFKINGNIGWGMMNAHPTIYLENIQLQNPKWATNKTLAHIEKLSIQVSIKHLFLGQVKVQRLYLDKPIINLERKDEKASWVFNVNDEDPLNLLTDQTYQKQLAKSLEKEVEKKGQYSLPLELSINEIVLNDMEINYNNHTQKIIEKIKSDTTKLKLNITKQKTQISIAARHNNKIYGINGNFGSLYEIDNQTKPFKYNVNIQMPNTFIQMHGKIENINEMKGINFNFAGNLKNIRQDLLPLGLNIIYLPQTTIQANVTGDLETMNINKVNINVANSDILLNGILKNEKNKKPTFIGKIKSNLFDIPEMFEQTDPDQTPEQIQKIIKQQKKKVSHAFKDIPFPIDLFQTINIDLGIKIKKLMAMERMPVEDIAIQFGLKDGNAILSPIQAKYAEGTADITILANMSDQKNLKTEISIEGKDLILGDIVENAGGGRIFDNGRVNTSIYLKGEGENLEQLMGNLSGTVKAYATERIMGYGIADAFMGKDLLTSFVDTIRNKKEKDIKIYCAVTHLKINNGIIKSNRGIATETNQMNIVADGNVNFKDETLDISIVPIPVEGLRLGTGSVLQMLRIKGTLTEPKLVISGKEVVDSATRVAITTAIITVLSGGTLTVASAGIGFLANQWLESVSEDNKPCETAMKGTATERPEDNPNTTPVEEEQKELKTVAGRQIQLIGKESKNVIKRTKDNIQSQIKKIFNTEEEIKKEKESETK